VFPVRSRLRYSLIALAIVILGLATRPLKYYSEFVGSALGDALYAALIYILIGIAWPRLRPSLTLIAATSLTWLVEVSQLWHTAWFDAVRQTTLGALALGGTFSFGDLGWYLLGTVTATLVEQAIPVRARVPDLSRGPD
jgi:hypothetical protein